MGIYDLEQLQSKYLSILKAQNSKPKARGLVDAPLAIALQHQGGSSDVPALLSLSEQQIKDWIDQAMDIDTVDRKLPWFYLAEAIAVYSDATYQLHGISMDNQSQIAALRTVGIRKLNTAGK